MRLHRQIERVAHDPLDPVPGVDRFLHGDLELGALAVEAAGARVEPLRVLADHDEVHIVLGVARHERLDARIPHDRPQVHPLVQPEPRLQQQVALEDARLHPRVADGPEEDRVERAELFELLVGQHLAGPQVSVGAQVEPDELRREPLADGVEDLQTLAHDLGAGAVARDHADAVAALRHGVSSFEAAAPVTWSARFTAAR